MRRFGEVLTTRGRAFCSAGITLMVCGYVLGFRDLTRVGVLLLGLPLLAGLLARRRIDRSLHPDSEEGRSNHGAPARSPRPTQ